MTTSVTSSSATVRQLIAQARNPGQWELLALGVGLLALYVPTYLKLAEQIWSQEGQGHGPVMLALTGWLVWQRLPTLARVMPKPATATGTVLFVLGLLLYILGKSQDFPEFETGSQLFVFIGLLLIYRGWAGLKVMWFPLFFLIFLIPLPQILVAAVTAPLKAGVSVVAEAILYHLGYPMGRTGVTLIIGQYRLLVADACAGLNSIFALEAIGVFYLSMMQYTNQWRNIALATLVLPISFVSNVCRVIILVLVTYYFGDEAGQGFVHGFAGILLFMVATALTIGIDTIIGLFVKGYK